MSSIYCLLFCLALVVLPGCNAKQWNLPLRSRAIEDGGTRWRLPNENRRWKPSSGINVPVTDYFNRTDCQWYTTISIGTPPQNLTILFDTGSSDLLIPQSNCTTCAPHDLFDPSKSTTYSPLPGLVQNYGFSTGADSIPWAADETVRGYCRQDNMQLEGLTSTSQGFLLCDLYAPGLDTMPIDGIMGMTIPNATVCGTSFYWNLYESGQLTSPVFSFYIPTHEIHGAELTLGGIDHAKYEGELHYLPMNKSLAVDVFEGWAYNLPAISAGGKALVNGTTHKPFGGAVTYLDTGTAFLQTPDYESARDLYAQISPKIKQIDPAGAWGAPCAELEAVAVDVTYTFASGIGSDALLFNATMPKSYFNLGEYPGQPGICQAPFNNPVSPWYLSTGEPFWLIGSPLLKAYYTVWDGINLEIGFGNLKKTG